MGTAVGEGALGVTVSDFPTSFPTRDPATQRQCEFMHGIVLTVSRRGGAVTCCIRLVREVKLMTSAEAQRAL